MKRPTMKREVAIDSVHSLVRVIHFYATADAVTEFDVFGDVHKEPDTTDRYWIKVDARYDFQEVVAFIDSYGRDAS